MTQSAMLTTLANFVGFNTLACVFAQAVSFAMIYVVLVNECTILKVKSEKHLSCE